MQWIEFLPALLVQLERFLPSNHIVPDSVAGCAWLRVCNGLVSHLGGVKDSYPLNTTETKRAGSMGDLVPNGLSFKN